MNISKIIAVSAGLALAATTLSAQGFGPRMGGGRFQQQALCGGPLARNLNLTEAQQTNLKGIEARHQASLEAKLKAADEARDTLRNALREPAASDTKVKELHLKVAEAMTSVMLERRAMEREFETTLTPDQKATLEKQRSQGGPGRGMMGQGRGHGGCGFRGGF